MPAYFKKGEVLTAKALNDALNSVMPVGGRVVPGVQLPVRQNRTPQMVSQSLHPVYLDKASMNLPAGEKEGWYMLRDGELKHAPNVKNCSDVYLVAKTDEWGGVLASCLTSTPPDVSLWDPIRVTRGVVSRKIGTTGVNPYAGMKVGSCVNTFRPAGPREVEQELMNLGPLAAPANWMKFDIYHGKRGNTAGFKPLLSGGGLIEAPPHVCEVGCASHSLRLAPRVSLFHLDNDSICCAPVTGWFENRCTLILGEWIPLAKFSIGSETVFLNGYWVTPWRVGLNFTPSAIAGEREKKAWTGKTPILGVNQTGCGPWKRVSYTPGVFTLLVPEMFPAECSYKVYDYAVYEAPGTLAPVTEPPTTETPGTEAPGTEAPDTVAVQKVLYIAQMRRQIKPPSCLWCLYNTSELTDPVP